MKQVFAVIGEVNNWIRSSITDPKARLYSSTTLVAMGIIACGQMGVPATLNNLMRITEFSSMQIYRGTDTLNKHGLLERDDDGVWSWAVDVPKDIENIHLAFPNGNDVDELKAFISEELKHIQLDTPDTRTKTVIEQVVEEVEQFDPKKKKREPRSETGPKSLFGDAVLNVDD
jgi:hypothetical protein